MDEVEAGLRVARLTPVRFTTNHYSPGRPVEMWQGVTVDMDIALVCFQGDSAALEWHVQNTLDDAYLRAIAPYQTRLLAVSQRIISITYRQGPDRRYMQHFWMYLSREAVNPHALRVVPAPMMGWVEI